MRNESYNALSLASRASTSGSLLASAAVWRTGLSTFISGFLSASLTTSLSAARSLSSPRLLPGVFLYFWPTSEQAEALALATDG